MTYVPNLSLRDWELISDALATFVDDNGGLQLEPEYVTRADSIRSLVDAALAEERRKNRTGIS